MSANDLAGTLLLGLHAAAVWFCVGLVWTVQLLVYPGFAAMDRSGWVDVHGRHTRLMGRLIGLPWLVQGVTCAVLLIWRPAGVPLLLAVAAGACGAATVAVTLAISVPCHERLAQSFDADVLTRLTRTNWWRTAAWTLGGVVALAMLELAA
ncbi:hypothetical protein EV188_11321 [Actinomycetospora succinea]|uniref:DUF1772 domain-containing protein n=1 Tax=Actinomycetospora succinea TaxID=663603 RepID=A0A4R6UM62_9PSEU|nr:hypothetical protein [Actinomycetospora succinea]TDQ47276.1 hypothetical protein EV188_11321 [Actinomycetospora succinea]